MKEKIWFCTLPTCGICKKLIEEKKDIFNNVENNIEVVDLSTEEILKEFLEKGVTCTPSIVIDKKTDDEQTVYSGYESCKNYLESNY